MSASNAHKTPIARSLEAFAQRKARLAIGLLGQSLPCTVVSVSGWIVTVRFNLASTVGFTLPNVTIPVAGSKYFYQPLAAGDYGICIAVDGPTDGSPADLTQGANLSYLLFVPLGSAKFAAPTSATKAELYGPDGAIIRKADNSASLTVDANGAALSGDSGASKLTVNANGATVVVPVGKSLVVNSFPVAPAGLPSGGVWRDPANQNQLKAVP